MKEYQHIIDFYSQDGYGWFSKLTPAEEWGDLEKGASYLEKYWMSENEYLNIWKDIQNEIFVSNTKGLPDIVFNKNISLRIFYGGYLFNKKDFLNLQKCMKSIGESYFMIIENPINGIASEPCYRLKFPSDISWEEFTSGNFASSTFIESLYKEFFVFGDKAYWGRYAASDYEVPLDVLGFKNHCRPLFQSLFKQSIEDFENILLILPEEYKSLVRY